MPRPPKPTALLHVTGTYRKDRHGARNEPIPKAGIGKYSDDLPVKLPEIWDEIVSNALPGVLEDCDRVFVEVLCRLLQQFRTDPITFNAAKLAQMAQMLGKLGMNPVDRLKLKAPS